MSFMRNKICGWAAGFAMAGLLATLGTSACAAPAGSGVSARVNEPVIGGPCEGCEAVFVGRPQRLESITKIAPSGAPGPPLRIVGKVTRSDGSAAAGVIVYAYHTDGKGIYPRDERFRGTPAYGHGALRGWAVTDAEGRYRFDTSRPASYPNTRIPQHVHMHIIEPGCCTYYIDDIHFEDDPMLSGSSASRNDRARGGSGLLAPHRDENGVWIAERDIVLGRGVPGYAEPRGDQLAPRR
jgi:protocatechuate 3,4-dioxygenase beta subunit